MFRDLPRYGSYKVAGEWVADVPLSWGWEPARTIFGERKDAGYVEEQMLSVTIGRGVIPQADLLSSTSKKDSSNVDKSKYKLVEPGDVVYNKMRAWQGAAGGSKYRGIVSPAYIVMSPRDALTEYMHHVVRTPQFAKEAERWSYGITSDQWSLRPEHFKMIRFPVPPADEQTAIVKYLAHANARIDKAIAAKRRLIALLEEQIATRIRAAFERSDDRDSHRLRAFTGRPITGITPPTTESRYFENGTVDWHGPSSFSADLFLGVAARKVADAAIDEGAVRLLRSPSLLVVAIGATCGKSAIVLESTCTNQQVVAFSLDLAKCDPEFIGYQAKALERKWRGSASTATIPMISTEVLRSSPFWLPSLEEQREIAGLISEQRTKKSNAVRRINREITLLREFRTRLVADVVTGQVDVRAIAATLPDAPESFDNAAPALDDELEEVLDESEE